jgi:hypothetical protein
MMEGKELPWRLVVFGAVTDFEDFRWADRRASRARFKFDADVTIQE